MKFESYKRLATTIVLLVPVLMAACSSSSQFTDTTPVVQTESDKSLYTQATQKLYAAKQARAELLSPKTFSEGMRAYRQAESGLEADKDWSEIRPALMNAIAKFEQAEKNVDLADVTLSAALDARGDAKEAEAQEHASSIWKEADKSFREAVKALEEDGVVSEAENHGSQAEARFRRAELEAIKTNYLADTWTLLDRAEKTEVHEHAPKTLQLARSLVDSVEKILEQDRYDTDEARSVARRAKTEATHAVALAERIEKLKDTETTYEEMILAAEEPIRRIASNLDFVATFDEGFDQPTNKIISSASDCQYHNQKLQQQLTSTKSRNNTLTARVTELEQSLTGTEALNTALANEVHRQDQLEHTFDKVDQLFERSEANVLRKGNDVIIRLHGLNFAVGKAAINQDYYPLLAKVQEAIRLFPESGLVIEGHTDSFGGDAFNIELSKKRAEAVKQYLLSNMDLLVSRIEARGLGETKPVANNETTTGRKKNRRIDVLIVTPTGYEGTN